MCRLPGSSGELQCPIHLGTFVGGKNKSEQLAYRKIENGTLDLRTLSWDMRRVFDKWPLVGQRERCRRSTWHYHTKAALVFLGARHLTGDIPGRTNPRLGSTSVRSTMSAREKRLPTPLCSTYGGACANPPYSCEPTTHGSPRL